MAETLSGALVLFSGGQDSSVCLAWALERYARVETVGFDYGQRHVVELQARQVVRRELAARFPAWAARLGGDHMLDIRGFGAIGETAMTEDKAIEITEKGLPSTFVPGRNLVFLTYAAALADRLSLKALVGGMCETDFSGYPDCRRSTMDAMESALKLGMDRAFPIKTPLMKINKAETWAMAKALGGEALVELIRRASHTCYLGRRDAEHDWGFGCGTCPACELRANGWHDWVGQGRPAIAS
jgi:7-cyano-7-deazaguanine synthase